MKRPLPLHPLFFFAAPAAQMFLGPAGDTLLSFYTPAFAVLKAAELAALLGAGLLFWRLSGDRDRGFVAASLGYLALNFGAAAHSRFFAGAMRDSVRMSPWDALSLPLSALAALLAAAWALRRLRNAAAAARFLNIFSGILLGAGLASGLAHQASRASAPWSAAAAPALNPGPRPPDVYHIVMDGCGDAPSLRAYYGLDLSGFEAGLAALGVKPVRNVRADYPSTEDSLASALNLRRHPGELEKDAAARAIKDSAVSRAFRRAGYRYVYITSGLLANGNRHADSAPVYDRYPVNPLLLKLTPLWFLADRWWRAQIAYSFLAFREAAAAPGPKYVLFYVPLPHPPYLFSADGTPAPATAHADFGWDNKAAYAAQLAYLERELLAALGEASRAPGWKDAVVLLHSDHGTRGAAAAPGLAEARKLAAFCAARLPAGRALPDATPPAGFFRFIFDNFFGTALGPPAPKPALPAGGEGS